MPHIAKLAEYVRNATSLDTAGRDYILEWSRLSELSSTLQTLLMAVSLSTAKRGPGTPTETGKSYSADGRHSFWRLLALLYATPRLPLPTSPSPRSILLASLNPEFYR